MKTAIQVAASLIVASSLTASLHGQSLGDAAKKAEQERTKPKEGPAPKVFTNKDLPDAPPAPPPPPIADSASAAPADSTGTKPADGAGEAGSKRATTNLPPVLATDGQIKVTRVPGVTGNAIETGLTLTLHGPQHDVPAALVFRAIHEDRLPRVDTPFALEAKFVMSPMFAGSVNTKRPHVVVWGDDAPIFSGSVDGSSTLDNLGSLGIPVDLIMLSTLERATTIRGRLFNLEFTLTPGQVRLVGEFSQRVRHNPSGTLF